MKGSHLDRFVGMAVFAKVVESASFAAAARHFDMSPAMVSKHVRTLEERLGVRLLNRTTRHVSATEVGQNYYERCLRILAALDAVAGQYGVSQAEIAIAWLIARPSVIAPIASATSLEQLRTLFAATRIRLDDASVAALNAAGA